MRITMFGVNFGEAVLYQEENDRILVDCGAKYGAKGKLAYGKVKNEIDSNTKLIITHFDEDHYNGILEIPNMFRFKEIVLPLYLYEKTEKEPSNTMDVFMDTIRTWVYMKMMGKDQKISSLHQLFLKLPNLVNSVFDIRCVGLGDHIAAGHKRFEVLWPQRDSGMEIKLYSEELRGILYYSIEDKELFAEFMRKAECYVSQFVKIYRFYCSNRSEEIISDINKDSFDEELRTLAELYADLDMTKWNISLSESDRKRIRDINSIKVRNMNECSIVFVNDNSVAAFGDVSGRIIHYLKVNNRLSPNGYKAVKVQHHGTKSYWSYDIPRAGAYLVSNSGIWNEKWSIYENYGKFLGRNMVCTNHNRNRCDYWKIGNHCVNCKSSIFLSQTESKDGITIVLNDL